MTPAEDLEDLLPTEALGTVPLLRSLGTDELSSIAKLCKKMDFKQGEKIVTEGDAGLGLYVIVKGRATVERRKKTVAQLGRGDFFGEISILDNKPRSADVVASEPTTCLVLLRWNFWALVSKNKKVVRGLLEEMARRLRTADEALSQ